MKNTRLIALLVGAIIVIIVAAFALVIIPPSAKSGKMTTTGTLAVLITDPPSVPSGVSAVFLSYSNLQVHSSGASNSSGWTTLSPSSGVVELLILVNSTRTLAISDVASGTFDAVRFDISRVSATYASLNYSCSIFGNEQSVTAQISGGGVQVVAGQTSAALIDLNTVLVPLNNDNGSSGSSPLQFQFAPQVASYDVNASVLPTSAFTTNALVQLSNSTLAQVEGQQSNALQIESAQLGPTSLTVTVKNNGNSSVNINTLELSASLLPNTTSGGDVPATAFMAIFGTNSSSGLVLLSNNGVSQMTSTGYALSAGSSVTFSYSGEIILRQYSANVTISLALAVVSGRSYFIIIPGFTNGLSIVAQ